ncbi:MAG TPA: ROK family protein [Terracidiphilus sp.]|nr:ROK family protein [Terracidiphilus sp.]
MSAGNAMHTILGLDAGGTKTACVEGTAEGEILQRVEMPTRATEPFAQTFPRIVEALRGVKDRAESAGRSIAALSVSVGGPLRIQEGFLLNPPHLPGWHNVALRAALQAAFPDVPVRVEHDGNAGALAEFRFGAGRFGKGRDRTDLRHLIFLTFGTGVGAGLIVNGAIVRGATDTAGEIGHWRLAEDGPPGFGKRGSWESFGSGAGLVELAAEMYPTRWTRETAIRTVVEEMLAGDADALRVAEVAGQWMGRGMALLIDAFNPQMIVLGSLAVALGERVLGPARRVIAEEALPQAAAACEIVPAALGARIGDVAALMAALEDAEIRAKVT